MIVKAFEGIWNCLVGNTKIQKMKIGEDLVLSVGGKQQTKLRPDEYSGTLVADDLSVSYWQRLQDPPLVLFGMRIEEDEEQKRRFLLWTGDLEAGTPVDVPPPELEVNMPPEEYLRGVWQVVSEVGDTGGREGELVMLVASLKPEKGVFPESTELYLCYKHCPVPPAEDHPNGFWVRYDTMTINRGTGSLDSIHGHRSLSFMRAADSRRYIYATFHKDVPDSRLMPFERDLRLQSEGDGGGAWGAEGG